MIYFVLSIGPLIRLAVLIVLTITQSASGVVLAFVASAFIARTHCAVLPSDFEALMKPDLEHQLKAPATKIRYPPSLVSLIMYN